MASPQHKSPAKKIPAGLPPAALAGPLQSVARRHLTLQWTECAVLVAGILPALLVLQGVADWLFDLPWVVRLILLLSDLSILFWILHRFALTPWKRRLDLEKAALKVEKELPVFRSSLISALQLSSGSRGAHESPGLISKLSDGAVAELRRQGSALAGKVIQSSRLRKWARPSAVGIILFIAAVWYFHPRSEVLLLRIFLSRQALPTRTVVIPISKDASSPVGSDITLAARAGGELPRNGRLQLVYADGKRQDIPVSGTVDDPSLFSVTLKNIQQSFQYRFFLNDGSGPPFSVTTQIPPVLASVGGVQQYPSYIGLPDAKMSAGNFSLMAGSTFLIHGESTQSLQSATLRLEGANTELPLKVSGKSISGEFKVPKEGLSGFLVALVNQDGVASQENTIYHVEFIPDKPPTVELSSPVGEQMTVLPGAKIRLGYKVGDDHGLARLALKFEVARPDAAGEKSTPPAISEVPLPVPEPGKYGEVQTHLWDLGAAKPPWTEGCVIRYWIEVRDNNDATGPAVAETPHKTIQVVTLEAKNAEMLEKLTNIATDLDKVYNTQKKANEILDSTIRKNQP